MPKRRSASTNAADAGRDSMLPPIKDLAGSFRAARLKKLAEELDDLQDIYTLLNDSLVEDPPLAMRMTQERFPARQRITPEVRKEKEGKMPLPGGAQEKKKQRDPRFRNHLKKRQGKD